MDFVITLSFPTNGSSVEDFIKLRSYFQNNPEWELIGQKEERGRPMAMAKFFRLRKKDLKDPNVRLNLIVLGIMILQLGIQTVTSYYEQGRNQIKVENHNNVEIIVDGTRIFKDDSTTVQKLKDLLKDSK